MAYPEKYTRGYGFAQYQESHPASPLPGASVDAELDSAEDSIDEVVEFIKRFTRSDGRLANGSVGVDQLAADLSIGFSAPTTWETGINYTTSSTVFYGSGFYTCNTAHTSGASFDAEYWDLILDFGSSAQAAAASAAAALVSQTAAASSASAAASSASSASTSAGTATTQASAASGSASSASTSAGTATTQASAASASASAAAASAAAAAASAVTAAAAAIASGIYLSQYATLALADAAAAAAGKGLVIDQDVTLAAPYVFTAPLVTVNGGVITRGSHAVTGNFVAPDTVQIFDAAGTGLVTPTGGYVSFGWFGPAQDSTFSSMATDNAVPWQQAVLAANAASDTGIVQLSTLVIPTLVHGKRYGLSDGATGSGLFNIIGQGSGFYLDDATGTKFLLTLNGGGIGGVSNFHQLNLSAANTAGGFVHFAGVNGRMVFNQCVVYNLKGGDALKFTGFNQGFTFQDCYFRNCYRVIRQVCSTVDDYVGQMAFVNGIWQNDSDFTPDVAGVVQIESGDGHTYEGMLAIILPSGEKVFAYCDDELIDGANPVQNITVAPKYIEIGETSEFDTFLSVGHGTITDPQDRPRRVTFKANWLNAYVDVAIVDFAGVVGGELDYPLTPYPLPGDGVFYVLDENCSSITIIAHGDSGVNQPGTIHADATDILLSQAGRGISTNKGVSYVRSPDVKVAAYLSATQSAVTGDGTWYTVPFDTEIADAGGCHAAGVITIPKDGLYRFNGGTIDLSGIESDNTGAQVFISIDEPPVSGPTFVQTYRLANVAIYPVSDGGAYQIVLPSAVFDFVKGTAVAIQIRVSGHASKNINVVGNSVRMTQFSFEEFVF